MVVVVVVAVVVVAVVAIAVSLGSSSPRGCQGVAGDLEVVLAAGIGTAFAAALATAVVHNNAIVCKPVRRCVRGLPPLVTVVVREHGCSLARRRGGRV